MYIIKKAFLILCIAAVCLGLCACGSNAPAAEPVQDSSEVISFTDDLGREISVAQPRRVAALIGSYADVWCLAGGKDSLVAAADDSWTSFDLGLGADVVNIGIVKEPSLEKLLSAKPDLILASSNTAADMELMETLDKAGIPTAYFDIQHIDDYLNMLSICTRLTGCSENYEKYGESVKQLAEASVARADGSAPTVLCMRSTGSSCKVKGSEDFLLGEMLRDLGCINVADSDSSMLEDLSLEAIIKADPEYIFVVLQGSDPTKAMATLEQTLLTNPAWQNLTAVREGRFFTLEHALYNIKPNDRWGEAYEKLADILYPNT